MRPPGQQSAEFGGRLPSRPFNPKLRFQCTSRDVIIARHNKFIFDGVCDPQLLVRITPEANYLMAEISTLVTISLLQWLESRSVSGADWAADICDPEELVDSDGYVDWDVFSQLCNRLAHYSEEVFDSIPPLPAPAEIGREIAEELFSSGSAYMSAADVPVEILYIEESLRMANELFPELDVHADIASDGHVVLLEFGLPEDCAGCPAFFELIKGALEVAPLLLDLEPVEVAMEVHPEFARYAVELPRGIGQIIPLDLESETTSQSETEPEPLQRQGPQLVDPEVQHQAEHSFDHDAFIQSLAACADIDEVGQHLFRMLREQFDCVASQIWLDGSSFAEGSSLAEGSTAVSKGSPQLSFGESVKPPTRSLRLSLGTAPLGRIDLWDSERFGDEQLEQLENLLPWYSLAFKAVSQREVPPRAVDAAPGDIPSRKDSTAGNKVAETLESLASVRPVGGEDLLEKLVCHLAECVGAHTVVVSRLQTASSTSLQTVVAWNNGVLAENYAYDTTGSPCANVLEGELGCYPSDVRKQFKADASLTESQTESYLGVALLDRDLRVIGILSAWSHEPIAQPEEAVSLIRILARGAEAELQFQRDLESKTTGNARYRSLLETSHDLCVELSPTRGLLEVSDNVRELLGYSPEAFAETSHKNIIHPDDLPNVAELYREVQRENTNVSASLRIRHADGTWCWFEAQARSYPGQDGENRVIVSARNISESAILEQEHAQMVSIIQNSLDLIVLTSLNGSVLFLNTAGQRLLGIVSDEEARSKSLYDFVHEDTTRSLKFEIMPAVHRHKKWTGELALKHLKTQQRVIAVTSMFVVDDRRTHQPVAIAMICRDVGDRIENERALVESEQRYRMLADNPYDLIAELDEQGRFIYASPNYEKILGYPPEMLLGSNAVELVHPEDLETVTRSFFSATSQLGTTRGSFRALHRDGGDRLLETTMRSYRTSSSQIMSVLISRDITDQVESSETLRQTEQKLQQSQKMEAIGRMAGGIAHDFNNLLTAITGYCDLLLEELGPKHPARADAEEILKASERAAGLTHQLLAFSRRQVLQTRILDLNNLVADMDRMLRRLIGEDVELVTLLDGAAWPIKADPGQLQQVLLNLVVNSRDAMPQGGRIVIETANKTLEAPVPTEIDEIPAGEYLTLSVRDNGSGMSPDIRAKIFEPFFTTKESGKGTGLGLSTVIGIIQQTGGHIELESEDGSGTCFVVYLPRASEVPMLPERYLSPEQFQGSETIVLVEDSEQVRKLVVRCLERHGYEVLEAQSGIEALRFFNRHPTPIHLLLSDVILPKMNGFEIAKRARAIRPETLVIYMSGFTDDALSKHGVRAEDINLLEKPFTPSTLLRKVREFLDAEAPPPDPAAESPAPPAPEDESKV